MSYRELKLMLEKAKQMGSKHEEMRIRNLMKNKIIEHKRKNKKVIYRDDLDLSFLDNVVINSNVNDDNNKRFDARFRSEFEIAKYINLNSTTSFTKPYA
jgi:hypothetical protein